LAGVSKRFRAHPTSGTLAGTGSEVVGSAARSGSATSHDAIGTLTGQGAALSGVAAHVAIHGTSGALVGTGSSIVGAASGTALFTQEQLDYLLAYMQANLPGLLRRWNGSTWV
jgi:hypothetical protein